MKDIATTSLGLFIFADVVLDAKNLLGVALGLSGGISYSVLSYKKQQQQQQHDGK